MVPLGSNPVLVLVGYRSVSNSSQRTDLRPVLTSVIREGKETKIRGEKVTGEMLERWFWQTQIVIPLSVYVINTWKLNGWEEVETFTII